jgi:phage pi2 protein 07
MMDIELADICHAIEVATPEELRRFRSLIDALPYPELVEKVVDAWDRQLADKEKKSRS